MHICLTPDFGCLATPQAPATITNRSGVKFCIDIVIVDICQLRLALELALFEDGLVSEEVGCLQSKLT